MMVDLDTIRKRWADRHWCYAQNSLSSDYIGDAWVYTSGVHTPNNEPLVLIDLDEPSTAEADFLRTAAEAPEDVRALLTQIKNLEAEQAWLRSLLATSERSVRNFSAMWQQSAAQAAALYDALSGAMELLPGGTPTDLDEATYRIVSACDAALTAAAGAPFLTLLEVVRAYRQAVQECNGVANAEQALFAALDTIEKGPSDG